MCMKQKIKKRICDLLLNLYKIDVTDMNECILLNTNKIYGIDVFFIVFTICSEYNISLSKLPSYNDDVTVEKLATYIYTSVLQAKGESFIGKE